MQYMLILAADPEAWIDNDPADDGVIDDWMLYTRALADAGILIAGHGLHGTETATTVRVRSGERVVTDGPFIESKEHLIGYYVIDADNLDVALEWAAKVPNARIGSIEVRPILPDSPTEAALSDVSDMNDRLQV
jgi:hypothetical protein